LHPSLAPPDRRFTHGNPPMSDQCRGPHPCHPIAYYSRCISSFPAFRLISCCFHYFSHFQQESHFVHGPLSIRGAHFAMELITTPIHLLADVCCWRQREQPLTFVLDAQHYHSGPKGTTTKSLLCKTSAGTTRHISSHP